MRHPEGVHKLTLIVFIITTVLVIITGAVWGITLLTIRRNQANVQPVNTVVDGFPMSGKPAPDFNLIDQFGHPVTLSSLRGQEVVLAFIDSRCTTLCPLTATIMYDAKMQLGASAASRIELVAINANPVATSTTTVQAWSIEHGLLHQWSFLTGTTQQLKSVYRSYGVYDQVSTGDQVVHDPLTFIIDSHGHERLFYETLASNSKSDLSSEEIGLEDGMRQWLS
jgi:cytochrome oxidase Cu insertion factor (SCO1/SenC/PrrC family)